MTNALAASAKGSWSAKDARSAWPCGLTIGRRRSFSPLHEAMTPSRIARTFGGPAPLGFGVGRRTPRAPPGRDAAKASQPNPGADSTFSIGCSGISGRRSPAGSTSGHARPSCWEAPPRVASRRMVRGAAKAVPGRGINLFKGLRKNLRAIVSRRRVLSDLVKACHAGPGSRRIRAAHGFDGHRNAGRGFNLFKVLRRIFRAHVAHRETSLLSVRGRRSR